MIPQDTLSIVISIAILLSPFLLKKKQNNNELATTVITFGILGTFIGIFIGLINFEVNDIYGSVPQLLEGLKIAFLTSIAGMIAGILVKLTPKLYGIKVIDDDSEISTAEAILKTLKNIDKNQIEIFKRENEQLKNIEKALSGEGDTTLLTQLQKLRTTISDKQDDLIREFREFTKTMAENNSKALIDALTQVMKDFNTKINEQFGENFAQLNQAVEKILVWQEKYKEQVELMIEQLDMSVDIIERAEKSITIMKTEFSRIAATSDDLKELITLFSMEIDTIKGISESAKNAFPIIEDNISKLTKEFSEKVLLTTEELNNISIIQKESADKQIQFVSDTNKSMIENLNNLNSQMDSFMRQNAERIAKQVSELDKALQEELTKSLNSLASQLGSLSAKFAQDYTPITNKLKEIIQSFDGQR